MGTILIGNIKGPQGSQGIQGPQGPVGPVGPTGPGADIYNGLDQTEAGVAGLDSYQGRVLDQKKLDVAKVANNLTTAVEGYALDARQGKALDEKKLNASAFVVENNLTTTAAGHALDARQGKAINDGALFTVHTGAVYQNRIQNANLNFVTFNTGYKRAVLMYIIFQVGSADVGPLTAIATGFWKPTHNTEAPLYAYPTEGSNTISFYVNKAGSLCNGNQTLTAGKWYVCQGYYIAE